MGESRSVTETVAAARKGDAAAFAALVARFRPTALLVAQGACGDRELAEDAVQDGFLTAHRALKTLEEPAQFGPWLAAIVRNRARRVAREGARMCTLPLHALDRELLDRTPSLTAALPEPGEEATRALPEGIRETMLLYYFEDWSVGEIAALLERPVTTVKWQLHAGRALLRKRLGPTYENP